MTFIRTLTVCLIAAVASGVPAYGQTAPVAPPLPVSAEHLEAAKEVVVLSGIGRTFNAIVPQLADQTVVTITRTRPEVRTDLIAVLTALLPEFEQRNAEMIDSTARAFAGVMTAQALKDTAAFFKTDAGKQYVQMQPRVIDQMVVSLEAFNRQLSTDMVERVRVEMRKKGHNI